MQTSRSISFLFVALCLLILLVLQGCALTKVTSFKDPEYSAGKTYSKIAVLAPVGDLEARLSLERTFAAKFTENGITSSPSINIIPPTRKPTQAQIEARLQEDGYDGLLLITLTDSYSKNVPTPGVATTLWGKNGAVTTYSGGNAISKPRTKFSLQLFDVSSHQTVWVSSTFTAGNAYAGISTMTQSLVDKVVAQLKTDGLIKNQPQTPMTNATISEKEE